MNQSKPKRGQAFINVDTGQTVYLERIKSPLTYFVCDDETLCITGNFFDVQVHSLKPVKKVGTKITPMVASSKFSAKGKSDKAALNDFYISIALTMPSDCEECGKKLMAFSQFARRCCSCHILPKAQFPTIATMEENIIFMGSSLFSPCCHHNDWDDKGAEHRTKMNIYPLVLQRFNNFLKEHLNQKDLIKAYTYLNIPWQ